MGRIKAYRKEFIALMKLVLKEKAPINSFGIYDLVHEVNKRRPQNVVAVTSRTVRYIVDFLKKEGSYKVNKCLINSKPHYTFIEEATQ